MDKILELILPYVGGKEVLDVGCIEHDIKNKNKSRIWVHDFLKENAKHTTGIDILKEDIFILKNQGYDVYCKNAETFTFNKKFDVIFAGELIEHLSNPGLFLQQCKNHLKKNGILILTTPNAYGLYRLIVSLLRLNNNPPVNNQHTFWFSPKVINTLLNRHGFKSFNIKYEKYPLINPGISTRTMDFLTKFIPRLRETMIVFAIKNETKT